VEMVRQQDSQLWQGCLGGKEINKVRESQQEKNNFSCSSTSF